MICPKCKCDTAEVYVATEHKEKSRLGLALLVSPIALASPQKIETRNTEALCHSCGYRWKITDKEINKNSRTIKRERFITQISQANDSAPSDNSVTEGISNVESLSNPNSLSNFQNYSPNKQAFTRGLYLTVGILFLALGMLMINAFTFFGIILICAGAFFLIVRDKTMISSDVDNTPFYKKTWFLILCGIIFPPLGVLLLWTVHKNWDIKKKTVISCIMAVWFIITLSFGSDENTKINTSNSDVADTVMTSESDNPIVNDNDVITDTYIKYPAGMYKVGTDITAGEYVILSDLICYIQVSSDSTGTPESIITNENFSNRYYITVTDGQYLEFTSGYAVAVADAIPANVSDGTLPAGMYKVGLDLSAGEYKLHCTSAMGYFAVYGKSTNTLDDIVSNDLFETDKYITVSDGQYILISNAEIKVQ